MPALQRDHSADVPCEALAAWSVRHTNLQGCCRDRVPARPELPAIISGVINPIGTYRLFSDDVLGTSKYSVLGCEIKKKSPGAFACFLCAGVMR